MFIHLVSRKRVKNEGFRFETKLLKDETHTVKKGLFQENSQNVY